MYNWKKNWEKKIIIETHQLIKYCYSGFCDVCWLFNNCHLLQLLISFEIGIHFCILPYCNFVFVWMYKHQPPCEGKHTDWNRPPWPGTIANICMSCFMTRGPGKEHVTNKPPPTWRVRERSKKRHMSDHLPESFSLASILAEQGVHHQEGLWVRMIDEGQPGNQSHHHETQDCEPHQSHHHETQDCEPHVRAVLLGSLTLLLSARAPLPNKASSFVSTRVSSDNSLPSARQEPIFRPWKWSPFLGAATQPGVCSPQWLVTSSKRKVRSPS